MFNLKGSSTQKYIGLPVIFFFLLLFSSVSLAATYYVSPTGSATWSNAVNINTPTDVQTAFNNAVAGDIVYFRGGIYNVPAKNFSDTYENYYQPSHSGSAGHPITFQAYPSETPIFNGTAGGSGDQANYATIMGVYLQSYIVLDGFKFQANGGTKRARMHIGSDGEYSPPHTTTNVTIKNCDFNGGSTIPTWTDNTEGIRVDSAGYITILNCKLYNYREANDYHNTSAFKEYNADHLTIQNSEIYNNSNGIYFKRDCQECTISYNYIHNNTIGSYHAIYNNFSMPNTYIFHNVYANNSYLHTSMDNDQSGGATADNWQIYNNTFYNSGGGITWEGTSTAANGAVIYNNIVQAVTTGPVLEGRGTSGLVGADHNQWGTSSFMIKIRLYESNQAAYSSLSSWQASTGLANGGHPGTGDLTSNPLFTNASGSYSSLSDFKLAPNSPCKGAGRGGVDMGANIALVGASPNTKVPNPPSNLQ